MKSKDLKLIFYCLFSFTFIFNLYILVFPPNQISVLALSRGDRYYRRLSQWYLYAQNNNWPKADKLEKKLDPADIVTYRSLHRIDQIKESINNLTAKTDKSIEDWLELAKLQAKIGENQLARQSLNQARQLDPVRDDINQLFLQFSPR
jgi:hypothetical protein